MAELIRDTVFGHFVRLITKGRVLQYAEEKDPELWKKYTDREQTKDMALFGNPEGIFSEEKQDREDTSPSSGNSSQTRTADEDSQEHNQFHSTITGQRVDTEKGRDATMVTWFSDDDSEVCAL